MNAQEIIHYIATAEKKTPVKLYIKEKSPIDFGSAQVFGAGDKIVFGDWKDLKPILEANRENIENLVIENDCRNSAIPLLDMKDVPARIEPGAIIREQVTIEKNAVIMMGAILNIGAVVGEGTMIDMGVVLGGRATVGKRCHIGAGTVLAGVIESPPAPPRWSLRTTYSSGPTPWSSRASAWARGPWWPPGRWSSPTCPPMPWWPGSRPRSLR